MNEADINARTKPELRRAFVRIPITPEGARETCLGLTDELSELFRENDIISWELSLSKLDELEGIVRKVIRTAEGPHDIITPQEINEALRRTA